MDDAERFEAGGEGQGRSGGGRGRPEVPGALRGSGGAGADLGRGAAGGNLLGHVLRQGHEVHEQFADGEIGGLGVPVEGSVGRCRPIPAFEVAPRR